MKTQILLAGMLACFAYGCAPSNNTENTTSTGEGTVKKEAPGGAEEKRATATIEPKSGSSLTGTAEFVERDGQVTLTVRVENAEPGEHGIHLHQVGDCSSEDGKSAGDHWNPTEESHGKMGETEQAHSGDMGNLVVGEDGTGTLEFTTDRWTIGGDEKTNIIGKSILVHAKADDLTTQPSGDSGDRIGCGVIDTAQMQARK